MRQLLRRRAAARIAFAVLVAAPAAVPAAATVAHAQDAEALARAREQFRQGLSLEAAGDFARALAVFKEVTLVKSTPQVRFHIAFCEEKTGDYVQALGSYRLALHEAREGGATDVEGPAQEALAALEPKIPKLTVTRGDGAAVADFVLDEKPLAATSIGAPVLVNPGPHALKATAPGRKPAKIELSLANGESKTIEVVLEEAPPEAGPVVAPPPGATGEQPPPPPAKTSPVRIAGFVVGGVGIGSLIASGVFFGLRSGAISDLDEVCKPNPETDCPASAQGTYDSGKTYATVSTVTFAAGLGLLAAGTAMIVFAPSSKPKTTGFVGVSPAAPGAQAGASVVGRF